MSILMMSKIWALDNLEPAEKLVLLAIADFADDSGAAWPSIPTLARKSSLSEDTVRRRLHKLSAKNIVSMTPRKDKTGRDTSYNFQLLHETSTKADVTQDPSPFFATLHDCIETKGRNHGASFPETSAKTLISPDTSSDFSTLHDCIETKGRVPGTSVEGSTMQGGEGSTMQGGGLHHARGEGSTVQPSFMKHQYEPSKNIYSEFFETLWKDYPLRDGKKKAFIHFQATVKNQADCQRIRAALNNYLAHLRLSSWKSPKNGATWFNNWQDWETIGKPNTAKPSTTEPRRLQVAL